MRLKKLRTFGCTLLAGMALLLAMPVQALAAVNNDNVCAIGSNSKENWPQASDIASGTGIVMDAKTGTILYDKGMDDLRYPASITKIMTTLIALENASLDTQVTFTATGMADAYAGSSNIDPSLGETFRMEDCLYMIMLKSANDVSTQVAETVAGSVPVFVEMMNQKAAALGCTNTHFSNASGLFAPDHYTTARDMALITQEALKNAEFRKIASTPSYTVPASNMNGARAYNNHHVMMMKDDTTYYYDGCFGGKTGFTDESKNTLVTFCDKSGMELIVVVMYSPDGVVMFQDTKTLLDYACTNFELNNKGEVKTKNGDYVIDGAIMTKADKKKLDKAAEESEKESKKTSKASDSSSVDESSANDDSNTLADNTHVEKKSIDGMGGSGERSPLSYVVIGVLGVLILAGVAGIIASLIKGKHRR